ncbi:MAG TPA: histidinol dehydrogenase [Gammaproteobacteria bacterium]|nr:histidinol dehydrogenase [Gammaproteobacteria bacterium]
MKQYVWQELNSAAREAILHRPALVEDECLQAEVGRILDRVRRDGDRALAELTEELDGVRPSGISATADEFAAAQGALTAGQHEALAAAAANIRSFHKAQVPRPILVETAPGVVCERVIRPIESVGLYVPAGSVPLPSTALMLAIPAELAGCRTRILCTPPQTDGRADPSVLLAARFCGVQRVFKLGGAQAVAAMAYGTETVPKVKKIFGPGNTWVTEAKAQAAQDPQGAARDMPAGPSEVLVIADDAANPAFVAADLLSQAEHGPDSQVMLVTTSEAVCAATLNQLAEQQAGLSRRDIISVSLESSAAVLVDDLDTAMEVANRYAPEHLILQIENPRSRLDDVQAAGSVFLGPWAPESVGDYCSGTNHVLPTYGFARSYSSLGVNDFLRSMTVQELTPAGLEAVGPIAETLADLEGLDAHGQAVRQRLDRLARDKIGSSS